MKFFSKISKPTFFLSFVLFFLWLLGSIPLKSILTLTFSDQTLTAFYNHQLITTLSAPDFKYLGYEISDLNNNLPRPNLFTSSLISKNIDSVNGFFNFSFKNLYYADIRFAQSDTEYYSLHFII